nr:MAG TPA: Exonuclease VII small subunit [Caudoviricetes sp.]
MASNKSSSKTPPCIEVRTLPIPRQRVETILTIDKRCYVNHKAGKVEKRIRVSIFRKESCSVEMDLDKAIEVFKRGIALAEEIKAGVYSK